MDHTGRGWSAGLFLAARGQHGDVWLGARPVKKLRLVLLVWVNERIRDYLLWRCNATGRHESPDFQLYERQRVWCARLRKRRASLNLMPVGPLLPDAAAAAIDIRHEPGAATLCRGSLDLMATTAA
jgi:hypothetical protein